METNEIIKRYATVWRRLLTFIIDGLLIGLTGFGLSILFAILDFDWIFQIIEKLDWKIESGGFSLAIDFNFVIIFFFYYFINELLFKTTFGKLITRTKLVGINNARLDWKTIFVRTITRLIPFEQLSFLNSFPVGIHDSLSNTRVIVKDNRKTKN